MKQRQRRSGLMLAGLVLVGIGLLWTLQGLGIVPGSVMSGVTFWAVAGPVVALGGLVLLARGWGPRG